MRLCVKSKIKEAGKIISGFWSKNSDCEYLLESEALTFQQRGYAHYSNIQYSSVYSRLLLPIKLCVP